MTATDPNSDPRPSRLYQGVETFAFLVRTSKLRGPGARERVMLIHTMFDLSGWLTAALIGFLIGRLKLLPPMESRTPFTDPGYFIALGLGALSGAIFVGSLNLNLAGSFALGHSIAGGIIGGIVGVEFYKWANGIRGSTGKGFVAPLAAGIAVGRLGCFFAGLPDYTYGIPTALPWGVDFGDGIPRHPVQLYESAAMLVFLVVYLLVSWFRSSPHHRYLPPGELRNQNDTTNQQPASVHRSRNLPGARYRDEADFGIGTLAVARGSAPFMRDGFYLFVMFYGVQRFLWEFLKPYPAVLGPLNVFHLLCLAMIAYSLVMIGRNRERHPAR